MPVTKKISLSRSSSFSLATIFMVLLMLSMCVILYFMQVTSDVNRRNEVEAIVATDMQGLLDAYRIGDLEALSNVLHYRLKNPQPGLIYALANEDHTVMLGNLGYLPAENIPQMPEPFQFFLIPVNDQLYTDSGLSPDKEYNILATMQQLPDGYILLTGRNIPDTATKTLFINQMGWAVIIILGMMAGAGFLISIRVVDRINRIAGTADEIMATHDLSRRITVFNGWDDLSILSHILNRLFDRIESLMCGVREVSDNVAHDLRTPLTRIKNKLEALHQRAEKDQLPIAEDVEELIDNADHMLGTFSALLRIGNIESGKWQSKLEQLDLAAIVQDVVEFYEPLADDKEQTLHASLSVAMVMADRHLMFQAVANLVDNAIKYAPIGGDVHVCLEKSGRLVVLRICDSGKGVPPEEYDAIFRRFYRTDKARKDDLTSGNGLGLSMVKAIAELHNGTISAAHQKGQFVITLTLPGYSPKI